MTRTHKAINLAGIALPFVGLVAAIVLLWDRMVGPTELAILAVGYLLTGVGITVGYHRLFTHRSFETSRPVALHVRRAGADGGRGRRARLGLRPSQAPPVLRSGGRPAQPARGLRRAASSDALRGLWHAHTGWLFSESGRADQARYAKDLMRDTGLRVIARLFLPLVIASLLVPALVGWALIGGWYGFLAGLFWGGAVRIFLLHHVTFSINSICHFWGRRRFASRDESRNVWWLSWLSFGESWHNNHHAFPTSAFHGLRTLEIDPGGWVIWTLEKLGLAWSVVRIPAEKQSGKLAT